MRRPVQSPFLSSLAQHVYDRLIRLDGFERAEASGDLAERGAFGHAFELSLDVIGEGHVGLGGAQFEFPMECIGYVSNLDHLWHVTNMLACDSHVNASGAGVGVSELRCDMMAVHTWRDVTKSWPSESNPRGVGLLYILTWADRQHVVHEPRAVILPHGDIAYEAGGE